MKTVVLIISIVFSFCSIAQKAGKFKDKRDGKVYPTVKIGEQTWLAENLNAATFRNGDPIPEAKTLEEWDKAGLNQQPAWCYYDFRKIQDDPVNGSKYGKLYNWYAVIDSRGLAPEGWSVSTDDDWTVLSNAVGGKEKAGLWLKSNSGWDNSMGNANGYDKYGFCAVPAGIVEQIGSSNFAFKGHRGEFWTTSPSKEISGTNLKYSISYRFQSHVINGVDDWLHRDAESNDRSDGRSVRCVKD